MKSYLDRDHALHLHEGDKELILVRGQQPYLWLGRDGVYVIDFGDRRSMRRLAKALAKELGQILVPAAKTKVKK